MRRTVIAITASIAMFFVPVSVAADGGELFQRRCSSCHGKDGKGETAIGKKKSLRALGSAEVQAQSDEELTKQIAEGGASGDRQHAFKDKGLSDDDIAELVTLIRAFAKQR